MTWMRRTVLVVAWALSLAVAGWWGHARAAESRPSRFPLFTGEDFGFRVDQMKMDPSGKISEPPTGTFVVWINGIWYTAQQAPAVANGR